jgi:hypothetical protein
MEENSNNLANAAAKTSTEYTEQSGSDNHHYKIRKEYEAMKNKLPSLKRKKRVYVKHILTNIIREEKELVDISRDAQKKLLELHGIFNYVIKNI